MKKILIALALGATLVGNAQAQWDRQHGHRQHGHRPVIVERVHTSGDILVPLVIGGIFGAVIANANQPQPVVVQQPPQVIVQQAPQGFIQCPPGTMPFEQRGWVRNPWGQWIQSSYIECK